MSEKAKYSLSNKLCKHLHPNQYSRYRSALSPPAQPGLQQTRQQVTTVGPGGHRRKGCFSVSAFPQRNALQSHPYKFTDKVHFFQGSLLNILVTDYVKGDFPGWRLAQKYGMLRSSQCQRSCWNSRRIINIADWRSVPRKANRSAWGGTDVESHCRADRALKCLKIKTNS